ncbi:sugar isomerase (SIS) [Candidatus Magnetobacterium bavaricum]|uniref:Sugar isomerase (SIS) n=1 Tax=Candidatus Magnetobacterium bavaricum TaxID=29290 RepID=A0A0F3GK63_9BACT|nr:sugar isomerase (SIS) [Candidatus Magnetobacterium bavaricum]
MADLTNIFQRLNLNEFKVFIDELTEAFNRGSQIFICGNGGSAATSSHFVCDINKGVSYGKNNRFKVFVLADFITIEYSDFSRIEVGYPLSYIAGSYLAGANYFDKRPSINILNGKKKVR